MKEGRFSNIRGRFHPLVSQNALSTHSGVLINNSKSYRLERFGNTYLEYTDLEARQHSIRERIAWSFEQHDPQVADYLGQQEQG